MATDEELRTKVDAIERFVLKHFSHLYAAVEPAAIPSTIDGLRQIYSKTKETPKPPAEPMDPKVAAMAEIYKHRTSKPKKAEE
jgi:hypothetical protein